MDGIELNKSLFDSANKPVASSDDFSCLIQGNVVITTRGVFAR